jgi:hypothetical protein
MSLIYNANGAPGVIPARPTLTRYLTIPSGTVTFVSVVFPGGLTIHDIRVFGAGANRKVAPPSQTFQRKNGQATYKDVFEFSTAEARAEFERQVLAAVDRYVGGEVGHE